MIASLPGAGGGHTADSDVRDFMLNGGDEPAALAALKRLEAAANRTAALTVENISLTNVVKWSREDLKAAEAERDAALARAAELAGAIEDYLLWQPGRCGHAAAARRLRVVLGGPNTNDQQHASSPHKEKERSN